MVSVTFLIYTLVFASPLYASRDLHKTRDIKKLCYCPCSHSSIISTNTAFTTLNPVTTSTTTISTTSTTSTTTISTISTTSTTTISTITTSTPVKISTMWKPTGKLSWFIQYTGQMDYTQNVAVYNIDLFDTSSSIISQLQNRGVKVICYFSAGTYENWRPDASSFNNADLGNSNGWPGEKWLDVRSTNVRNIMNNRILLASQKGCDSIDPDNMDGYDNNPGFSLTYSDQLDFAKFIANSAHNNNLSTSLKNDLGQIPDLVNLFDYAVNEQCLQYNECNLLKPFTDQGKTVFHIEYQGTIQQICAATSNLQFSSILKTLDLTSQQSSCIV